MAKHRPIKPDARIWFNFAPTNFRPSQRRAAGRRSADPRSQKPAAHVAPAITELELSGRLERHPGGLLARIHNH
ncbi:hypothetical protein [uncultured Planktomarina sp.]|uniref:DprA-like winged helix domain-containing protein n=1 Tax=uncultured Planktomarina sp. TaxID=1538529 RepID=UPI0032607E88